MKKKTKLTDFSKEREKRLIKQTIIGYIFAGLIVILVFGGFALYAILVPSELDEAYRGYLYIYEGVLFILGISFHIITWKVFGWEQISLNDFKIHKMTGVSRHDRQEIKESEFDTLIAEIICIIVAIVFIIIGIYKLV